MENYELFFLFCLLLKWNSIFGLLFGEKSEVIENFQKDKIKRNPRRINSALPWSMLANFSKILQTLFNFVELEIKKEFFFRAIQVSSSNQVLRIWRFYRIRMPSHNPNMEFFIELPGFLKIALFWFSLRLGSLELNRWDSLRWGDC